MAAEVSQVGGLPASFRSYRSRMSKSAAPSRGLASGGIALRYRHFVAGNDGTSGWMPRNETEMKDD